MKMRALRVWIVFFLMTGGLIAQSAEDAVNLLDDEQGFGLRATAMGNAYTALSDDYSGIYWNPAGLTQIKVGQFSGSLSNISFKTDATFLANKETENQSATKFQSIGLVFPFPVVRGSFVMALGYQRIKDYEGYVKYNGLNSGSNDLAFDIQNEFGDLGVLAFDQDLNLGQSISNQGQLSQWSFAMAMDLSPNFSAGFTASLYDGGSDYSLEYLQTEDTNSYPNSWAISDSMDVHFADLYYTSYEYKQKIKSEFSGFEFKLGGLFKIIPDHLNVGAVITFPMSLKVDEDWSFKDRLMYEMDIYENDTYQYTNYYDENLINDSGVFDYIIKVPFKFSGGVSYNFSRFLLSASLQYQDWSQLKYDVPNDRPRDEYTDLLDQNPDFKDNFKAVTSYSLGAEVSFLNSALKLRGGFRYLPTPFKDLSSDYNKTYYSGGIGYQVDPKTMINLSYVRGSWKRDKYYSYDWDTDPMQTSEEYTTSKILLGATFNFR